MANWPDTLPQEWFPPDSPPSYEPADNTIRTSVSTGPAKLRRRFTAQTETVVLTGQICEDELSTLKDFVKKTLGEVKSFGWVDFRTNQPARYRFTAGWSSVKCVHFADDLWTVTMTLEMLPS